MKFFHVGAEIKLPECGWIDNYYAGDNVVTGEPINSKAIAHKYAGMRFTGEVVEFGHPPVMIAKMKDERPEIIAGMDAGKNFVTSY
jgi:hypothetical protein